MYMKNEPSCGRRRHHHRENCACLISSLVVVAVVFRVGVGTGGGVGWGGVQLEALRMQLVFQG